MAPNFVSFLLFFCSRFWPYTLSNPQRVRAFGSVTWFTLCRSSPFSAKELGHEVSSWSSPSPQFNFDNQVLFSYLMLEKTRYFPTLIRGDAWYSSSVPTTFGRDCLKEIWVEFPSEGNASDCHSVTIFRVNDVHFVSGNWTELFYFNLAWCRYSWNIIILQPPVAKQNLWLASSKMAFKEG